MDVSNEKNNKDKIIEKIMLKFNLEISEAQEIYRSVELYCEIITLSLKNY
jgi:hypothetical protein|tara:strand:+ start:75 stop:224 length:150 start_codon:yes stop_codon:yes gene_type:complete